MKLIKGLFTQKMIKFIFVGILNTVIGASIMFLAYNLLGFSYWVSSACNYVIGSLFSFVMNKYFTFNNKEKSMKQVVKFIIHILVCYLVAYGVAKPIIMVLFENSSVAFQENVAMLAGMVLFTVLNYIGQLFFVFKEEK